MSFNVVKKIQEVSGIITLLGVIGFVGIVWLMIYGNLSGNLGFDQDLEYAVNEQITLNSSVAVTFADTVGKVNPAVTSVVVTNGSDSADILTSANYTLTDTTIIGTATNSYNNTLVNLTYTTYYDSLGQTSSDGVITNMTGGYNTFFGFTNTFFTISAIILLIFMLLGLLALVMYIMGKVQGKSRYS
jgi:hypothetical protein